jgi:1-acyl-sn-glycerol-3-phosphate acyltransferase
MPLFLIKMKVFLARLYSIYGGILFLFTSIIFLLPQIILAQKTKWHPWALRINFLWAWTLLSLMLMPVRIQWSQKIDKKKQYILCSNHFSFLDIPANYLLGLSFKYIGKSSIAKAPIFGYMFKKIHIMVNRESMRSRGESMQRAKDALSLGFNMCFFPEGGIRSENPPKMVPFRDGAFRLACEFNHPILPVALIRNHKIFPDDERYLVFRHPIEIIVGDPIYPTGKNEDDIKKLKIATFEAIQMNLDLHQS